MPAAKRISSLVVASDLVEASAFYAGLSFTRVETDDRGCVGYVAGEAGVILADRDFASRCWGETVAQAMADRSVPYVFLDRLDRQLGRGRRVLADTVTWFGTHEQVIGTDAGLVVLVEQV